MPEFHQNRSQQRHCVGREQHQQWTGRGVCDAAGAIAWDGIGFEVERGSSIQEEEKEKKKVKETQAQYVQQWFFWWRNRSEEKETQET